MSGTGGPGAEHIGELFWAMLLLGGIVFVVFCVALAYALVHGHRSETGPTPERDLRGGRTILLLGGIESDLPMDVPSLTALFRRSATLGT